jgi:hypothetical protein
MYDDILSCKPKAKKRSEVRADRQALIKEIDRTAKDLAARVRREVKRPARDDKSDEAWLDLNIRVAVLDEILHAAKGLVEDVRTPDGTWRYPRAPNPYAGTKRGPEDVRP